MCMAPYYHIKTFEDPTSLLNAIYFVIIMVFATVIILLLSKYNMKRVIYALLIFSIFLTLYIAIDAFLLGFIAKSTVSIFLHAISIMIAIFLTVILFKFKRWYIIDFVGIILAVTIGTLFGISLIPIVSIVLLLLLAIYDYISVYKTKHMITLADDLIDYNLPLLLVIPKDKNFSMADYKLKENRNKNAKKDRKALIIGLGDLIIPTILIVSSNVYVGLLPSIGAIIGGVIGLFFLLRDINNSKPKAGLPFLNGGVILGFLITLFLISIIQ